MTDTILTSNDSCTWAPDGSNLSCNKKYVLYLYVIGKGLNKIITRELKEDRFYPL